MSSLGNNNQNNFPPYDTYKDCSQGICTIYCPQWCYMIFPPPPFRPQNDDGAGPNFSPLIIAVIAILASAFLLVSYYTIISKYCKRRSDSRNPRSELDFNIAQFTQDQLHTIAPSGLEESQIKSIPVCKYKKSDGFVDETECSVCLSEFQETEDLRLLPKCSHAFHVNCIDIWLRSNSNCPLCRSVVSFPPQISVNLVQNQRSDVVLVVDECDRGRIEEVFVGVVSDVEIGNVIQENDENGCSIRRSISMGSSFHNIGQNENLLISDILKIDEDDQDSHCGEFRSSMNRSCSLTEIEIGKGKNQVLDN